MYAALLRVIYSLRYTTKVDPTRLRGLGDEAQRALLLMMATADAGQALAVIAARFGQMAGLPKEQIVEDLNAEKKVTIQ